MCYNGNCKGDKAMAKPKQNENRVSTFLSNENLEKLKKKKKKTEDSV